MFAVEEKGVRPMVMKNREYRGYLYVNEQGAKSNKDFRVVGESLSGPQSARCGERSSPSRTQPEAMRRR